MFLMINEAHPYIAIIGDIIGSKKIKNRKEIQEKLKQTLNQVNEKYDDVIASKFIITLGDEFQGLLNLGNYTMEIIYYIKKELYPVKIRFGVGVGSISTRINKDMAIGADGPGYYKAREAINNLKELENKKKKALYDIQILIDGDNNLQELSLNSIFKLMYSIESHWTSKQREIIDYMLFENDNQSIAAQYFGVSQSNIQQILSKSHYYAYAESFHAINSILSEVNYHAKLS